MCGQQPQPWGLNKPGNMLSTATSGGGNMWDLGEIFPAAGKNKKL